MPSRHDNRPSAYLAGFATPNTQHASPGAAIIDAHVEIDGASGLRTTARGSGIR